jgi:salicylate hydroxylase
MADRRRAWARTRGPVQGDPDIALIGAGIGGLTAALALQRVGLRPTVHEQAATVREVGAGLTLAPNATRVLLHLGLGSTLQRLAVSPAEQCVQHYRTGEVLVRVPRGDMTARRWGAPYWQIHRADLHSALLDAVHANDPDCVQLGRSLAALDVHDDGVRLQFSNGPAQRCGVLVGCDGIRSVVRTRLFGEGAPAFTGYVAWRGVVPIESLPAAALEIPAGLFIGPDRMFARYRVRGGALLNYVGYARLAGWEVESWTVRSEVGELAAVFHDFHRDVQAMIAATPPEQCFKWALFSRRPLPAWSVGRATLLGDAAHPTLPFLGQGANLAIEDALVLARALATDEAPAAALARYERARTARGAMVMERSLAAVERYFSPNPERFDERRIINEQNLGLFDYDAATVPI